MGSSTSSTVVKPFNDGQSLNGDRDFINTRRGGDRKSNNNNINKHDLILNDDTDYNDYNISLRGRHTDSPPSKGNLYGNSNTLDDDDDDEVDDFIHGSRTLKSSGHSRTKSSKKKSSLNSSESRESKRSSPRDRNPFEIESEVGIPLPSQVAEGSSFHHTRLGKKNSSSSLTTKAEVVVGDEEEEMDHLPSYYHHHHQRHEVSNDTGERPLSPASIRDGNRINHKTMMMSRFSHDESLEDDSSSLLVNHSSLRSSFTSSDPKVLAADALQEIDQILSTSAGDSVFLSEMEEENERGPKPEVEETDEYSMINGEEEIRKNSAMRGETPSSPQAYQVKNRQRGQSGGHLKEARHVSFHHYLSIYLFVPQVENLTFFFFLLLHFLFSHVHTQLLQP